MRRIKELVERIDDELESAEEYAEKYIEYKADGDNAMASKFEQMAEQEMNHADMMHSVAVKEIEKVSAVYNAPADMREKWDKSHTEYIQRAARIKSMLNL